MNRALGAGSSRPRVLLLSVNPFFGGGEAYLLKLAGLLRGHCGLRAVVAEAKLARGLRGLGIETEQTASRGFVRYGSAFAAMRRACRAWHPDWVHLNGQGEMHLGWPARLLGHPVVAVRHTQVNTEIRSSLKRRLVMLEHRAARHIVCVSAHVQREVLNAGMDARRLSSIPNWVEDDRIAATPRPDSRQGEPFRLLIVGRLVPLKGVMDALQALKLLKNTVLDVAGEGPQRAELEAAALRLGLPVQFHGFQTDCAPFYDRADLLLFPSHSEGQGLALLEAMARGLPCLVSDIPAALETVDYGRCGATYRRADSADMARQIGQLQGNPARRAALAAAGLERVRSVYRAAAVKPRLLALYGVLSPAAEP